MDRDKDRDPDSLPSHGVPRGAGIHRTHHHLVKISPRLQGNPDDRNHWPLMTLPKNKFIGFFVIFVHVSMEIHFRSQSFC